MPPERPRFLKIRPVLLDGETACELRDPLGIAAHDGRAAAVTLSKLDWTVANHFDGKRSVAEVASAVSAFAKADVGVEHVTRVEAQLTEHYLLDDEHFREARDRQLAELRAAPERLPAGPGRDYEADVTDLRIRVGGLVANDWDMPEVSVRGLVTPEVDFGRAGRLYARSYGAIRRRGGDNARVVVMAPAPGPMSRLLVPCSRSFATPLGTLPIDREALEALELEPGPDELAHRAALGLERQALFLRLLFGELPIVPLLTGAFPAPFPDGRSTPAGLPEVEAALAALRRVWALPGQTLVVAAVDFAHAGIGHASPWSQTRETTPLRALDADCADLLTRVLPEDYWRRGQMPADPARGRNMVAPYLLTRLLEAENESRAEEDRWKGSVLGYEQMMSREELVTAASIAFH